MKIFLYGNVLNNAYNLTRFLRQHGYDAEMFLDDTAPSSQNYPWWEHGSLAPDALPSWIHYHRVTLADFTFRRRRFREMARQFSACDVALVSHWGPILAEAADVPCMFFSYGGDLLVAHSRREVHEMGRRLLRRNKPGLRQFLVGLRQRKALQRHVSVIGIAMGYQIDNYMRPLGLLPKMVKVRLAWDIDEYLPRPDSALVAKYEQFEIVYFMLARHSWLSVWNDLKGNDKFIRAFARFVKGRKANVRLVMISKGPDVGASRRLVTKLGIDDAVEWVTEMPKDHLRRYYSLPNVVVVDQFWDDRWRERYPMDVTPRIGFGSGSIEALCAKRPLITAFFEQEFYEGDTPPILSAFTEDEILVQLNRSLDLGAAGRRSLGERGHEFVRKYHDWRTTTAMYSRQLEGIYAAGAHRLRVADRSAQ
jgi:glycosyltransferase involved in cell wall biosynthesis